MKRKWVLIAGVILFVIAVFYAGYDGVSDGISACKSLKRPINQPIYNRGCCPGMSGGFSNLVSTSSWVLALFYYALAVNCAYHWYQNSTIAPAKFVGFSLIFASTFALLPFANNAWQGDWLHENKYIIHIVFSGALIALYVVPWCIVRWRASFQKLKPKLTFFLATPTSVLGAVWIYVLVNQLSKEFFRLNGC